MSQVSHPSISITTQLRSHRAVTLAWLLALFAAGAVVLVLALDADSPVTQPVDSVQALPGRGTDAVGRESSVAAAVGTRATPIPDESHIAAAVAGAATQAYSGPDESRIAASVGARSTNISSPPFSYGVDESRHGVAAAGSSSTSSGGPDESRTAASISGR